jgi:hypothetical protein
MATGSPLPMVLNSAGTMRVSQIRVYAPSAGVRSRGRNAPSVLKLPVDWP